MIEYIKSNRLVFEEDLKKLIAIQSTYDETTVRAGAPFGAGIRAGFDFMIKLAEEEGFLVKDMDGYAMHIEYGSGEELVGLLCHMDIVGIVDEASWSTDPFKLVIDKDTYYGRGVNDNKGPLLACFYLLKAMKANDIKLKKRIRLIIGGAEETTWQGIKYYFSKEEMPTIGISPDGNFPIVHIEKGIRHYRVEGYEENKDIVEITSLENVAFNCHHLTCKTQNDRYDFIGNKQSARHSDKKDNALMQLVTQDTFKLNAFEAIRKTLFMKWPSHMTSNISSFNYLNGKWSIAFDIRWSVGVEASEIDNKVNEIWLPYGTVSVSDQSKALHMVDKENPLISYLKAAYKTVTSEEAELLVKGGASYARALECGVAFGPCFQNEVTHAHLPNECQSIENLFLALEIYWEFLKECEAVYETSNHADHKIPIGSK